jgi:hypothetical protein
MSDERAAKEGAEAAKRRQEQLEKEVREYHERDGRQMGSGGKQPLWSHNPNATMPSPPPPNGQRVLGVAPSPLAPRPANDTLRCCASLDVRLAPHRFTIDFAGPSARFTLAGLHVRHICDTWLRTMPAHPRSWDDGVNGLRVVHLLFSSLASSHSANDPRGSAFAAETTATTVATTQDYERFCHATDVAHYARVLTRADLVRGAAVWLYTLE